VKRTTGEPFRLPQLNQGELATPTPMPSSPGVRSQSTERRILAGRDSAVRINDRAAFRAARGGAVVITIGA
jgi:hypothetical protein